MSPIQTIRHQIARLAKSTRVRATALSAAALVSAIVAIPGVRSTPIGQMTNAVADAPATLVKAVEQVVNQQYLGFDTNIYPGDRAMAAWAKDGTYDWVGFYLEAPCHKDDSWSGKRDTLNRMGWGVAVVYVGQQTWSTSRKTKKGSTCSNAFVTASHGTRDGADAVAKAIHEGFPHGTTIFLDIERVNSISPALKSYYSAWTRSVLADGRYRPGFYVHSDNAARVHADVTPLFVAAGDTTDPPFWVAGNTKVFSIDKAPTDVGHTFAAVWQGMLDVTRTHSGIRLPIDINVAALRSPSQANSSP